MAKDYRAQIDRLEVAKRNRASLIIPIVASVGTLGTQRGYFTNSDVRAEKDVHGFYPLARKVTSNPARIETVHLQAYPGMSDDSVLYVSARVRDHEAMLTERKDPRKSIGNEHNSNIARIWGGSIHPAEYDAEKLLAKLAKELDKMRGK